MTTESKKLSWKLRIAPVPFFVLFKLILFAPVRISQSHGYTKSAFSACAPWLLA